jgi:hypothetical protein
VGHAGARVDDGQLTLADREGAFRRIDARAATGAFKAEIADRIRVEAVPQPIVIRAGRGRAEGTEGSLIGDPLLGEDLG